MVFITAGMGGGTGTGAAPVIAKACRERGVLTVGVVTKPFHFEGSHRMKSAEAGIEEMQDYVDTLIVIPNQNLFRIANEKTTFAEAFRMADSVLQSGVRGVTDLMVRPGLVNLDFADIRTAMLEMGKAMMGTGEAEGDKRAIEAAESAINNPLLDDVSMKGAHGVIINVTGGYDMTLFEADEACNRVRDEVDPDANIIFGATFDESLEGAMRVSIVATGIEKDIEMKRRSGHGAGRTNAVSGQTLERANPNTVQKEERAVGQQMSQQSSQPGSFVPAAQFMKNTPQSAGGAVAKFSAPSSFASEPESDLFEQNQFAAVGGLQQQDLPYNTVMRGTRYKDSFIPPKPMEPEFDHSNQAIASGASQSHMSPNVVQGRQTASTQTVPGSSLQLNPPRPPSPEERQQRSPSLLERITGTVQQHLGHLGEEAARPNKQRVAPSPYSHGQAPADTGQPSQGSLNIERPSKPSASSESDLDIPAFLRRQAN